MNSDQLTNLNCDKIKTSILTKLKKFHYEKNSRTNILTKLNNSYSDKNPIVTTKKLIVTKLTNSVCDQT